MKKILIILALLGFVNFVDAQKTNGSKTKSKATQPTPMMFESVPASGSIEDQIHALKHNIRDAHHQVEELHKRIHEWTKELAPLEVQLHHEKASKKRAQATQQAQQ